LAGGLPLIGIGVGFAVFMGLLLSLWRGEFFRWGD
jgi:hypothetical protein